MTNKVEAKEKKPAKELADGPTRDRSITDFICCVIMLVFWAFTIFLMYHGYTNGDPWKLVRIYDSTGTPCGNLEAGTLDYPYAFFYHPIKGLGNVICVKECPGWQIGETRPTKVDCFSKTLDCTYDGDFNFENVDTSNSVNYLMADFLMYNTTTVLNRFCLVSTQGLSNFGQELAKNISMVTQVTDKFEEYYSDLGDSQMYLFIIAGVAFLVSILSLIIIRYFAGIFAWIVILLYLVGCFGLAYAAGEESKRLEAIVLETEIPPDESNTYYTASNLYILSITMYVIGSISLLVVLFSLSTISLSIAVIKSAGAFVASNYLIVFVPILMALVNVCYVLLWFFNLIHLWSIGEVKQRTLGPFAEVIWDNTTLYYVLAHIFSLLWNVAFINYIAIFIIGCTCCIWYFNPSKDSPGYFRMPIFTSFWWAFRYHLGSLAFGAFILAVIWSIQLMLAYVTNYVKKLKDKGVESRVVDMFLKCMTCFVACFERVVKFISKIGFIQVAISGQNFCQSCIKAVGLLFNNPLKFGFVHALGEVFVFIGKIFVSSACGAIGYMCITYDTELEAKLYSKMIPVIVFCVIGYVIASIFFSVYGVAADAILLCFFWSKENGDPSRPIAAPEPMRKFYEKWKKE